MRQEADTAPEIQERHLYTRRGDNPHVQAPSWICHVVDGIVTV